MKYFESLEYAFVHKLENIKNDFFIFYSHYENKVIFIDARR